MRPHRLEKKNKTGERVSPKRLVPFAHALDVVQVHLLDLLQDVDLQLGRLPVLVHVLDHLERQDLVPNIGGGGRVSSSYQQDGEGC